MRILRLIGLALDETNQSENDGLAEIVRQLDALEPSRARFVACFAYLLGRVARADHEVSEVEATAMERLVSDHAGLAPAQAALTVRIATAHGLRFGGTDDFLVSREFNRLATPAEKHALLDCLFAVSASDASIRTLEDNEIRRIANELQFGHQEYIAARAAYVHHLEVLRSRTPEPPA